MIFAKGNSPLYLTDLLALIKDDRVMPYLGERRSVILGAMNTVNALRKDAHANDVSDHDFYTIGDALAILEGEFAAP
jgi:hypothetical protein